MQPVSYQAPPPLGSGGAEPTVNLLRFAWDTNMAKLGTFVGLMGMLIVASVFAGAAYFGVAILQGFNFLRPTPIGPTDLLWAQLAGVLAGALLVAPVTAGVYGVVFRILRYQPEPMSGFSAAGKYFLPAAGLHIATGLLTSTSTVVCRTLLGPIWSGPPNLLFASIVGFLAFLILPAIVGLDMKLGEAVTYAMGRVMSRPFSYLGYFIAAEVMACLGLIACGVGIVLTGGVAFAAVSLLITGVVYVPMEGDPGAYPRYPQQQGY